MQQSVSLNSQNTYEVRIQGQIDESWLEWFGAVEVRTEMMDDQWQVTMLSNIVTDQAGLVGLIRRLHGLGIVLVSVRQVVEGE